MKSELKMVAVIGLLAIGALIGQSEEIRVRIVRPVRVPIGVARADAALAGSALGRIAAAQRHRQVFQAKAPWGRSVVVPTGQPGEAVIMARRAKNIAANSEKREAWLKEREARRAELAAMEARKP